MAPFEIGNYVLAWVRQQRRDGAETYINLPIQAAVALPLWCEHSSFLMSAAGMAGLNK